MLCSFATANDMNRLLVQIIYAFMTSLHSRSLETYERNVHRSAFKHSLFTALDFSASKPWLVRPAKQSDCKVTDCSFHVQRVSTRSNGNVVKDIVTLNEEKGEITYTATAVSHTAPAAAVMYTTPAPVTYTPPAHVVIYR